MSCVGCDGAGGDEGNVFNWPSTGPPRNSSRFGGRGGGTPATPTKETRVNNEHTHTHTHTHTQVFLSARKNSKW